MFKDSGHMFSRGQVGERKILFSPVGDAGWSKNNRQYLKIGPLQLASPTGLPGTVLWDYPMTVCLPWFFAKRNHEHSF